MVRSIATLTNNNTTMVGYDTYKQAKEQQDQPEGLVDGMACEPDEHMRRAIVEKAKELGMGEELYDYSVTLNNGLQFNYGTSVRPLSSNKSPWHKGLTYITPGEFYDRMCKTAKPEPPIRIGGHDVQFLRGSIKVGCTEVTNDIVRKVAERLKD